ATTDFVPLDASRAAVPRRPGGQLWPRADKPPLILVPLPFAHAGPHPVVVRPEVLVPNDQGGVRRPELAPTSGAPADRVDLLVDDARPTHQPQHQRVVADVRALARLERAIGREVVGLALQVQGLVNPVADTANAQRRALAHRALRHAVRRPE